MNHGVVVIALIIGGIVVKRSTQPLGIRQNNPGNIEKGIDWQGLSMVQPHDRFARFKHPKWGVRAMARILKNYQARHGLDTIRGLVGRWAPEFENPTASYVHTVAKISGIPADAVIDVEQELHRIIPGFILHENGKQPYSDDLIAEGIRLEREA